MHILVVTDAWFPQVNGVVRTLDTVGRELVGLGHDVRFLTPQDCRTVPCPSYPEIRLVIGARRRVRQAISEVKPDAIHIATEGPLGHAARRYCVRRGLPFTTAYHTRFPEYIHARWRVPLRISYAFMRRFHRPSMGVMVATPSMETALAARGFGNFRRWSRGVDLELFRPRHKGFLDFPRPISMFVGRVAIEKNIEAFLKLDIPGTKCVVGDGPALAELRGRFPEVRFVGAKQGEDLACHYAAADVFVFPSLTDTFGLVMLEALASGVPVAAYPVEGPLDVIGNSGAGCLGPDLETAVRAALAIPSERCRAHALTFSWRNSAEQFLNNLSPVVAAAALDRPDRMV